MKSPSGPHAVLVLFARLASAAFSLASSPFLVPSFMLVALTAVIRSANCSAALFTWTVKPHDAALPDGSCAVLLTVVVPIANTLPDAGVDATVAEQLSVATGAKKTAAPCGPVASTVIGDGQKICGPSTSLTVTLNKHAGDSTFCEGGGGVHCAKALTWFVPTPKAVPDGGVDTAVTPGHMPSTFGANETTALHVPGSLFTVMGAGHSIVASGSVKNAVKFRGSVVL